ncbi:MAG TPA: PBP1A family penicillin-binding protein [Thermoanaerobaculia bacterium]|jgi:penicillin-binding protein 1B|nr:PBP1A family penicillin-binding protein [Thermoanaerobaculia bacterium]
MQILRSAKLARLPWTRRRWVLILVAIAVVLTIAAVFIIRPFWKMSSQFKENTFRQPSRLYGRATRLFEGRNFPPDLLIANLQGEGYREDAASPEIPAGRYRRSKKGLAVHLRSFPLPDGSRGGGLVEIAYDGGRIASLRQNGADAESVILDPPLIASYYGPALLERRPLKLAEVSPDLIAAVLAAEDDGFYSHAGFSVTGMMRAVWVDLRGHGRRQGGSTLTQQLVKNLYLTQEKTLSRKSQEFLLAVLLEARYNKKQILEAYLNEIYMGGGGGVSLMGMGAASRAFFGKDANQLDLAEAATLAGMIQSPANYSPMALPIGHPDKAKERRDWVLGRMADLKLASQQRIDEALREPVVAYPEPLTRRRAPYFADSAALEASRRFGVEDLEDGGYVLFSTLDWQSQKVAQEAVSWGLDVIEKGYQKGHKGGGLQGALISLDPETGGILAYLGGRQYEGSQFDRIGRAQRQVGSAFKPVVYAAAFEEGKATPATLLEDEPLTVNEPGQPAAWSPKNDDGESHGLVTARTALEKSYNLATARLAMDVGMPRIIRLAKAMGISTPMEPYPSMALGAASITPLELATVYATFANGGARPPVHELVAVLDRHGKPLQGAPLPKAERVLSAQSNYLVTSLLEGVLIRGTAGGAAGGISGELAGKTGTTNKQRDSWFAGYAPQRTTVVWVGYDDNSRTRLSGARAALPIWVRFMARVAPPGGYGTFRQPRGLTTAAIDPTTGLLATEFCPGVLTEVFKEDQAPTELCNRHQSWLDTQQAAAEGEPGAEPQSANAAEAAGEERKPAAEEEQRVNPFRRWLRRVFGSKDKDKPRESTPPP